MITVNNNCRDIFSLDAPGGTDKTFSISLISTSVASFGTVVTLLEGRRTAHFALKPPQNFQTTDETMCNIAKKKSAMAKVLQNFKIIICDECMMAHK